MCENRFIVLTNFILIDDRLFAIKMQSNLRICGHAFYTNKMLIQFIALTKKNRESLWSLSRSKCLIFSYVWLGCFIFIEWLTLYLPNALFLHSNLETITYTEDTLVSRNPSNEKEIKISDVATKVRDSRVIFIHTCTSLKSVFFVDVE